MTDEQHMMIVKPVSAWARQASAALETIEQANNGTLPARLADAKDIDPTAFGLLVEALVALEPATGSTVDPNLIKLAGLRPVDEVIE